MKNIIIFISALFIFSGCEGSSSNDGSSSIPEPETTMIVGQAYTVNSGDRLIKTSTPSFVEIQHTDGSKQSTVTLTEGSAKIIRNP